MKQIKLLFTMLILTSTSSIFSDACCPDSPCNKVRQCAKNTLYRDGFNMQFHAGVSPIIWANRGSLNFLSTEAATSPSNCLSIGNADCAMPIFIDSLSCTSDCATAINRLQTPEFNKLFRTPWTIGATLGYAVDTHHEVFVEFNYVQAATRHAYFSANVTNIAAAPVALQINLPSKYKNVSAYFGYRYNFDRMRCFPRDFLGDMAWFLGIKAGLLHHYDVRGSITSSFTAIAAGSNTPYFNIFKRNTSFSGAGEVGVDICLNCSWSLMVAAEIAAGWGLSCNNVALPITELSSLSIRTARIGAEILFPVTIGLRYKF